MVDGEEEDDDDDGDDGAAEGADTDANRVDWARAGGVRTLWEGMFVCFDECVCKKRRHTVACVAVRDAG